MNDGTVTNHQLNNQPFPNPLQSQPQPQQPLPKLKFKIKEDKDWVHHVIHVEFVKLNVMQKSKSLMKMLLLLNIHLSSSEIDEIKSGKRVLLSSGSLLTSTTVTIMLNQQKLN